MYNRIAPAVLLASIHFSAYNYNNNFVFTIVFVIAVFILLVVLRACVLPPCMRWELPTPFSGTGCVVKIQQGQRCSNSAVRGVTHDCVQLALTADRSPRAVYIDNSAH
eukprot:COSAG01_NODE_862_length_13058_cov_6.823366_13_plen_108_part_00